MQSKERNGAKSSWARWVSNLFIPPTVFPVLGTVIAYRDTNTVEDFLLYSFTYSLCSFIVPFIYIFWLYRKGAIGDVHMAKRSERFRPFGVAISGMILAWVFLIILNAPSSLLRLSAFTVIESAIIVITTFSWQISVHGATVSSMIVIVAHVFGPGWSILLFPLLPLAGAARWTLKRHNLSQILVGMGTGALTAWIIFNI